MDTGYTPANAGEALPGLTATAWVFRRLPSVIATGGLQPDTTFAETSGNIRVRLPDAAVAEDVQGREAA